MTKDEVAHALDTLDELGCIEKYESLISIVQYDEQEFLEDYSYDIPDDRYSILHTLIKADKLDHDQLTRIAIVDRFILKSFVPEKLKPLQKWLQKNALIIKNPDDIQNAPSPHLKPSLINRYPSRYGHSKREHDYNRCRYEVYLNKWEGAQISQLQRVNPQENLNLQQICGVLHLVNSSKRLSPSQKLRLIVADVRLYTHPDFETINCQIRIDIIECLHKNGLEYHYAPKQDFEGPEEKELFRGKLYSYVSYWDWFNHTWENEETRLLETEEAILARRILHYFYKANKLSEKTITTIIELDKKAILSPNWVYLNAADRLFISEFLIEQKIFNTREYDNQSAYDLDYKNET